MTDEDALEIRRAINSKAISTMPPEKLKQFALLLASPNAYLHFGVKEFEAINKSVSLALRFSNQSVPSEATKPTTGKADQPHDWSHVPLGKIAIGVISTLLAGAVFWVIAHYLGLKLN